jgi:SRSO17 transposase
MSSTACWVMSDVRRDALRPRGIQDGGSKALLGRDRWTLMRYAIVREYVIEHVADDDAVLLSMRPGSSSMTRHRAVWPRQYTGSAGKITNCQIGVFAVVSRHGRAFIDRALQLPKSWTGNPGRLSAAKMPEEGAPTSLGDDRRRLL